MSTGSSWDEGSKTNNPASSPSDTATVQTSSTKCGGSCDDPASSPVTMEDGVACLSIKAEDELEQQQQQQRSYHCGWFAIRPKWMARFMTPKWALFWLCWAGAVQGLVVNGFINVVITTIERRFGLRSTQTGLVASGYDIASFLCLVPVSYFGGRLGASKPRWIGWGVAVMGLGAFVFALPHFLVGPYRATTSDQNVCVVASLLANGTSGSVEALTELTGCGHDTVSPTANGGHVPAPDSENLSWNVWFFFTAQLLLGAGASPLYTLGVTYIDENVSKKMSSVYLGIYYTMAVVGPAAGYVIGGQLLLFYTDMFVVDATTLGLTPHSKVWVGAWWIGFVFMAAFCLLLAIPILAYPSALPGSEKLQKVSEAHRGDDGDGERRQETFTKIKQIPRALLALLRNPTFFFLNLAGASEGLVISGFAVFLPKLIENQFSVTAVWSALLMGIITVPAGGGGTFLGGYLVKKLHLSCSGIIKFCLFATIFAALFTVCFFLSCPNLTFAGVTAPYFPHENLDGPYAHSTEPRDLYYLPKHLENACNDRCACSRRNYEPICGADGVMYYSPCHAGCGEEINLENAKVYRDCTCINATFHGDASPQMYGGGSYDAVNTMCQSQCGHLWMFVALCFLVMFFTFLATMPALSATLRCVHDDQRSFALGIQWIKVRVLGTIPAPMIFGRLIDETCILWQESSCDDHGACLVYDNAFMSKYMLLLALIGKACSILFFFGAWFYYIPPKAVTNGDTHQRDSGESKPTVNGHIAVTGTVEKY
ncbi:solute carrier organic anion transporter family member 4A1 [Anopheles nili]|uniref:solute carrier organic anion transporter family member 4A1 n=1 Tax=Anopheles nili TaxID=185578 RepID=UPI00237AA1CA|nr:solute carrier organic anion transporter family member 4A1 [Anopheles nili]